MGFKPKKQRLLLWLHKRHSLIPWDQGCLMAPPSLSAEASSISRLNPGLKTKSQDTEEALSSQSLYLPGKA
jgi:hypothetical protein